MSDIKYFGNLLKICSVLPALLVMPAKAFYITEDTNLNELYPDGCIGESILSMDGRIGVLTTDYIGLISGDSFGVVAQNAGSRILLGDRTTKDIYIESQGGYAVLAQLGAKVSIGNSLTERIEIIAPTAGMFLYNSVAEIKARNIEIINPGQAKGTPTGISVQVGSKANIAGDNIKIHSDSGNGIQVLGVGAELNIHGKKFDVSTDANVGNAAIHVANNTSNASDNFATFNLVADEINVKANVAALAAMSQGILNVTGNAKIAADYAIVARGGATVNVNRDANNTLRMDGDIRFLYDQPTSGTAIDAFVNVTLAGAESYWNGNTVRAYNGAKPTDDKLQVTASRLDITNGAVWNATTVVDDMTAENVGQEYVALNDLTINNGTVNIQDADRGITVDRAAVSGATINGAAITVNETLNVNGGNNTFNSNVFGDAATVNIADGATLNMNNAVMDVNKINLDGTLIATLDRANNTAPLFTANAFEGNGNLSLVIKDEGEYNVFGGATFAGIDSAVYNLDWNGDGTTVRAGLKSAGDIAADNGLSGTAANTVLALTRSGNDMGLLAQETLSGGDTGAIEHAAAALNPENTALAQSVATGIRNSIANIVSVRLADMGRKLGNITHGVSHAWAQGMLNKTDNGSAFDYSMHGIAAGLDVIVNKDFTVGAGYAFHGADADMRVHDADMDANTLFIYGQYKPSQWYVNTMAHYTMAQYDYKSYAFGRTVNADRDVNSHGIQTNVGYELANGVTPELGLSYLHMDLDKYRNDMDFSASVTDADFVTASAGAKYALNVTKFDSFLLRPQLHVAANYDVVSQTDGVDVIIPGAAPYGLSAKRLNRFAAEMGAGLSVVYRHMEVGLHYDLEWRGHYTSHTGMFNARYRF